MYKKARRGARAKAQQAGQPLYPGGACIDCGSTWRRSSDGHCAECRPILPETEAKTQRRERFRASLARRKAVLLEAATTETPPRQKLEDIPTAMRGVDYGGDNAYPDAPPYNLTDQPPGRNFSTIGNAAFMCVDAR